MAATPAGTPGRVLAIAAHPDDIEFMMGGTLCLLMERAWEGHYLTLANGSLGSVTEGAGQLVLERSREAAEGASLLGAAWHPSLVNDCEILYSVDLIRRVTALIREIRPTIILTQAPDDYLEDHIQTARIATTAAFNRSMPNFQSLPPVAAYADDVYIYHAQPHGLHDQLRRLVFPEIYVDTAAVQERKRMALAAHKTQVSWLDTNQAVSSPTAAMDAMARMVGRMSGRYEVAEGWRRHSHLGFSAADADPLIAALGDVAHIDEDYTRMLRTHPATGREFGQ